MTRASRQRRARAARMQSIAVDDDEGLISQNEIESIIINLRAAPIPTEQELEIMQKLEVFETLLADPNLPDVDRNDLYTQQAECLDQLEFLCQQNEQLRQLEHSQQEDDYMESQEDDVHEFLNDQQLDEQIREISEFESMQEGERQSLAMAQRLTEMSSRPAARPTNQNRSFKGYILNPNQDEVTDDSNNTHPTSPGSSTSILSADFGDDDVLPIEETSCVICQIDYRHGDEILRNANGGSKSNAIPTTPCNHVFHTECITSWIVSSGKSDCPCCRSPFSLTVPVPP